MKLDANEFVIGPKRETAIGLADVEVILEPLDTILESVLPPAPIMTYQYTPMVFVETLLVEQYTPMVWSVPVYEYEEITLTPVDPVIWEYEDLVLLGITTPTTFEYEEIPIPTR